MHNLLAVIPARGGSKRIPHKNIKEFNGRPLIAYPIECAKKSDLFVDTVVSTDDPEIASISRLYGASVPFLRSASLADDFTGTTAVGVDAYLQLKTRLQRDYEALCIIYATTPLLTSHYLKKAYQTFNAQHADYLFACCEFPFPIQRGFYLDEENQPLPVMPECQHMRSQDLQPAYQDAGQFYFYSKRYCEYLLKQKNKDIYADDESNTQFKKVAFPLPRYRVIDIDTPEDWEYALILAEAVNKLKKDDI